MSLLVRRSGNLMELSTGQPEALPLTVRRLVEPPLTYLYKKWRHSSQRRDPVTGVQLPKVEVIPRNLYQYDTYGRLCFGVGLWPRVRSVLEINKLLYELVSCDAPHERPDRFITNWDAVVRNFQFRPGQDDCLVAIAGNECGIISAPCGFGKGESIRMICTLYDRANIHVVVPGLSLVEKTVATLSRNIPGVGQLDGTKCIQGRVTVISAGSLEKSDGDADILIGDEIHRLAAPTYARGLARYRRSRNYGFSATPEGRLDGADAELESLFGPIIWHMPYSDALRRGLVVPIRVEWLDVQMDDNPVANKTNDTTRKRHGIWRNKVRNEVIAEKLCAYGPDIQVLVLVETVEHALHLRKLLPDFQLCYSSGGISPVDAEAYVKKGLMCTGEEVMTAESREALRLAFAKGDVLKVIATSVWGTGVDFPLLQVVVRADGMASPIQDGQLPGRVSRINDVGKEVGIVIDCVDQFDDTFRRRAVARRRNYAAQGWENVLPKRLGGSVFIKRE